MYRYRYIYVYTCIRNIGRVPSQGGGGEVRSEEALAEQMREMRGVFGRHDAVPALSLSLHTLSYYTLSLTAHSLADHSLSLHTLSLHTLSLHSLSLHTLSLLTLSHYTLSHYTLSHTLISLFHARTHTRRGADKRAHV